MEPSLSLPSPVVRVIAPICAVVKKSTLRDKGRCLSWEELVSTSVTGGSSPSRGREVPLSILPTHIRTLTSAWFSPQGRVKLPSHSDVSLASHCLSGSHPIPFPPCPFLSVVRAVGGVLWPCLLFLLPLSVWLACWWVGKGSGRHGGCSGGPLLWTGAQVGATRETEAQTGGLW